MCLFHANFDHPIYFQDKVSAAFEECRVAYKRHVELFRSVKALPAWPKLLRYHADQRPQALPKDFTPRILCPSEAVCTQVDVQTMHGTVRGRPSISPCPSPRQSPHSLEVKESSCRPPRLSPTDRYTRHSYVLTMTQHSA